MEAYKKIKYLFTHGFYHPYFGYWFDLFTERHVKNRIGECVNCIECWGYSCGCLCEFANAKTKRCTIYNWRNCDVWFPVSQKELEYMSRIKPNFSCKFSFKNKSL